MDFTGGKNEKRTNGPHQTREKVQLGINTTWQPNMFIGQYTSYTSPSSVHSTLYGGYFSPVRPAVSERHKAQPCCYPPHSTKGVPKLTIATGRRPRVSVPSPLPRYEAKMKRLAVSVRNITWQPYSYFGRGSMASGIESMIAETSWHPQKRFLCLSSEACPLLVLFPPLKP